MLTRPARLLSAAGCRVEDAAMGLLYTRRHVVFSHKPDWEKIIRRVLDYRRFSVSFCELTEADCLDDKTVIPLTVEAAIRAAEIQRKLRRSMVCHVPAADIVRLCDDKVAFNRWMIASGFGHLVPGEQRLSGPWEFPFILKKRHDVWGRNSFVIRNAWDAGRHERELRDVEEYFGQEYVQGGEEYTTHVLMKDERIVYSKTMRFRFDSEFYVKGVQDNFASDRKSTRLNSSHT